MLVWFTRWVYALPQREDSPSRDVDRLLVEGTSGHHDSVDDDIILAEYFSDDETKEERCVVLRVMYACSCSVNDSLTLGAHAQRGLQ